MKIFSVLPLQSVNTCAFAPCASLNYMDPYYEFDLYIKDYFVKIYKTS